MKEIITNCEPDEKKEVMRKRKSYGTEKKNATTMPHTTVSK
jgi:hypothetical protein